MQRLCTSMTLLLSVVTLLLSVVTLLLSVVALRSAVDAAAIADGAIALSRVRQTVASNAIALSIARLNTLHRPRDRAPMILLRVIADLPGSVN
jgi:hypothetical protein